MPGARPSSRLHPHIALGALAVAWYLLGRADDVTLARSLRFAMLVVVVADLTWAVARTRRASVRVVDQPTDAFVGDVTMTFDCAPQICGYEGTFTLTRGLLPGGTGATLATTGGDTGTPGTPPPTETGTAGGTGASDTSAGGTGR